MGRKKILFGSIFVLLLILLMPSIPAIQQKTIEDKAYSDLLEKLEEIDLEDIDNLDRVKHPLLMWLVIILPTFRFFRGLLLLVLSIETEDSGWHGFHYITGIKPLLFLWGMMALMPCALWWNFWMEISNKLGWGWSFY